MIQCSQVSVHAFVIGGEVLRNLSFRRKANGVPILSKSDMEDIAVSILGDYKSILLKDPMAMDIEHFIECYANLLLDYQDLTHDQSILGMTVFNDGYVPVYDIEKNKAKRLSVDEGTIIIDNFLLNPEQQRRGRFTLAHEVSHWILHRHIYLENKNQISLFDTEAKTSFIRCRSIDVENNKKRDLATDDDWMEWHADYLASTLLMPRRPFAEVALSKLKEIGINKVYQMGTDFDTDVALSVIPYEIGEIFDVSATAANIRLKGLGYIREREESLQCSLIGEEVL